MFLMIWKKWNLDVKKASFIILFDNFTQKYVFCLLNNFFIPTQKKK